MKSTFSFESTRASPFLPEKRTIELIKTISRFPQLGSRPTSGADTQNGTKKTNEIKKNDTVYRPSTRHLKQLEANRNLESVVRHLFSFFFYSTVSGFLSVKKIKSKGKKRRWPSSTPAVPARISTKKKTKPKTKEERPSPSLLLRPFVGKNL